MERIDHGWLSISILILILIVILIVIEKLHHSPIPQSFS